MLVQVKSGMCVSGLVIKCRRVLDHPRCSLASAAHPATAEHLFVFAAGSLVRLELDTD